MSIVAATLLVLAAGAADPAGTAGGQTSQPSTAKPQQSDNPDDPVICQSDKILGSRIKRKKICMKRSEWQRQHQEEKMMIDRTQVLRGVKDPG